MPRILKLVACCGLLLALVPAHAKLQGAGQTAGQPQGNGIPPAALAAKTIAVVNDTRDSLVTKGASNALQAWGQFTLVDDPSVADLTLRFEKTKEHEGSNSQSTDPDTNKTNYGYSMSFSSSIHMKAYLKDGDVPFYTTKTDDAKAKAGTSCVNDFRTALRSARQPTRP